MSNNAKGNDRMRGKRRFRRNGKVWFRGVEGGVNPPSAANDGTLRDDDIVMGSR
jgi:hypothetical protein